MRITVTLFASLRERAGTSCLELDLPADSRISDVWPAVVQQYPALEGLENSVAWAVNHTYVKPCQPLNDGDEVAVLPPVSGGSGEEAYRVDIVEEPIDLAALLAWARTDADGAVVTFQGTVRDFSEGQHVTGMEYHGYPELALKELAVLAAEVRRRWPVGRVALIHRTGTMGLGDVSVAIVIASPHRGEAFDACRFAIDTLKQTIPIWKKEHFRDKQPEWVAGTPGQSVEEVAREDPA